MTENRRSYHLKLKEDLYNSETMVILESMQDSLLYSDLLLKMYLMSLKSSGVLLLNDYLPHTVQTIATFTRHQVGTVERALKIFREFGLVEILTDGAYHMSDIQLLIGQSSSEGEREKKERMRLKRQNLLPSRETDICPSNVRLYNTRLWEIPECISIFCRTGRTPDGTPLSLGAVHRAAVRVHGIQRKRL